MFMDASAIVAIIKAEPEAAGFLKALDGAKGKVFTSPVARYEAVISLAVQMAKSRGDQHLTSDDHATADELVSALLAEAGAREVHISESIGQAARSAALTYGKLAGHPAKLNMGDCFAYACAKAYHVPLLYKGDDFKETDLG
ncbi:type II toxin-antitoxin system VapC family toxin [uncultured Paracoccus sp.]|uniref:type II toxin-antitoxin system VapC family toxin n=1 Tax=uncultured Paracoccus sp. TaxID=189685 RepID=UPI00260EE613|nr:type II toxin-antitoxin system VapC family toxin [uncultured Paracoccus sp.]